MSDTDRYLALVDELRELVVRIHGAELFVKKPDAELLQALQAAGRALRKARKVAA